MNKNHVVIGIIGAVLLGGGLWFLLRGSGEEPPQQPPAVTLSVGLYRIADHVEALGTTQANESVTITAQVAEVISDTYFEDGQQVKKGFVIARLQQDEEQAELAAAKAQRREHEREIERLKTLLANKAAARREYDERLTQLEVTKQLISQIEARIADRTLTAPFAGVLGVRRLSPGALVQPGEVITTLDDLSVIKLDFSVPDLYLPDLKPGTPIAAHSESLNATFDGMVETVNTRVDPVTRSVLVRALLPNPESRIKPGLLMNVSLLQNARQAILVPEESVQQRGTDHFVSIVATDKTVKDQQVSIGLRRPGLVEITKGLAAGYTILVRGMGIVRPGQAITVREEWSVIPDLPEDITPVNAQKPSEQPPEAKE